MNTLTIKSPPLVNITAHSYEFQFSKRPPTDFIAEHLHLGDLVSVLTGGKPQEEVWLSLAIINRDILTGIVHNPTIFTSKHGLHFGDTVRFCVDNIFDIQRLT